MILDFDDELGPRHFEFCFVGFILGGSLQEKKGLAVLRTEVALFDKLEALSDLKPCGKKLVNGEPDRHLKPDAPHQLVLEVSEFDLLYRYISQVSWHAGTPAKHALATLDWLQRAPRG